MSPFDCPTCVVYMLEVTQTVSSELSWLTPDLLLLLPLSVTCSVYATVHAKDKQNDLQRTLFIGVCVLT